MNSARLPLEEMSKDFDVLSGNRPFQAWVESFRLQFMPLNKTKRDPATLPRPKDAWTIKKSNTIDHRSTLYEHAMRSADEIDRIRNATGQWAQDIVVFKPERMALHETIAAAITRIQMQSPAEFLRQLIISKDGLLKKWILPEIQDLNWRFDQDRIAFESYVDHIMDDPFHIVNPSVEIGSILSRARAMIDANIKAGKYCPALSRIL
jgi:hypothetical protein